MIRELIPKIFFGGLVIVLIVLAQKNSFEKGFASAQAACKDESIKTLTDTIATGQQLVTDANAASLALNKTIADRIATDLQTTSEIRRALTTTAHLRVECVLPDSVMRQLTTARQRANKAATSGVNDAMPTTAGADR